MRTILFILSALAVIGSGYWAYRENYQTQDELDRAQGLRAEITAARERLAILRAEWAYLNRPDRLRDLAALNFDRLGLIPLRPDQFGRIDQVAYPLPPELEITDSVEVSSVGASNP
ncbi:cell division protein FtsL [Sagittula sp. SSi028]|uniref:cell division protein FtsL n=1 Tax=Sagittula sp. SSi028 TaxID=3400636 RepID=UPI003AF61475